jgi:hypothetical protein
MRPCAGICCPWRRVDPGREEAEQGVRPLQPHACHHLGVLLAEGPWSSSPCPPFGLLLTLRMQWFGSGSGSPGTRLPLTLLPRLLFEPWACGCRRPVVGSCWDQAHIGSALADYIPSGYACQPSLPLLRTAVGAPGTAQRVDGGVFSVVQRRGPPFGLETGLSVC